MPRFKLLILEILMHLDAASSAPLGYFRGIWWAVSGKRVRARSRLAPILARSKWAYSVWIARWDRTLQRSGKEPKKEVSSNNIIFIIDATANRHLLGETLESISSKNIVIFDREGLIPGSFKSLEDISKNIKWDKTWVLPVYCGDTLSDRAEERYIEEISKARTRLIFSDDDQKIDGKRCNPHFKPEWNRELFHHFDYISGSCILKINSQDLISCAQSNDWISNLTRDISRVCYPERVAEVLHHRYSRPNPQIRKNRSCIVDQVPTVSVIIPTRNHRDLLGTCLDGVAKTQYPNIDVIVIDNDSDDPETLNFLRDVSRNGSKVLKFSGDFNYSKINNFAVGYSRSSVLCFLNNDIEISDPNWLSLLVKQSMREDVGAVGPMLLYPDGTIQHAGVVMGVGGGAAHAHRYIEPDSLGYWARHRIPQFVSAVTGACLVVQRQRFLCAGGFDEVNFPVAFNDVDLCLKLRKLGYASMYEPRTHLIHHESKSRGNDRDPVGRARLARELQALKDIWHTDKQLDPYHHPSLSPHSEQFVINI